LKPGFRLTAASGLRLLHPDYKLQAEVDLLDDGKPIVDSEEMAF
jgi:hypothetical protein